MTDLEAPEQQDSPVSKLLSEAREAKGMSQKDVADQLYLAAAFIRYIDEGDFHKFQKPAFVKGYLRSYARVVGLSGDKVVATYNESRPDAHAEPDIRNVTEEPVGSASFTGPVLQTGAIGLIAILIVGGLVWWFATDHNVDSRTIVVEPSVSLSTVRQPTAPQSEAVAEVRVPVVQEASAVRDAQARADLGEELQSEQADTKFQKPEIAAKGVQIERVKDGDANFITIYAGGEDAVEFSFSDECWVGIVDGKGEKVYSDLNHAGDVMTLYGVPPFDILLGRTSAVIMVYNGTPVDLGRFATQEQTARVRTARL
jgi:cytoskeleton protein RodZ